MRRVIALLAHAFLPILRLWMRFAGVLNAIMTRAFLIIAYCLVFVPIGLLRRAVGADPLGRARESSASTYWRARTEASSMDDPF